MMINELIQTRFIPLLDSQMDHLRQVQEFLDAFRAALIRRDMDELQRMQELLSIETQRREELDNELKSCKQLFEKEAACASNEICVSMLCRVADPSVAKQLKEKQRQIQDRLKKVKNAHLATELLLRECARINRRLLEIFTGRPIPARIYDARGKAPWQGVQGLMSVKL